MQEKPATIEPWVDGAKPPSKGADALQMRPESGTFVREGATSPAHRTSAHAG